MKRLISWALTLAMILSLMAGMCFTVSAESTVITEVRLTGQLPPVPVMGGAAQVFVWSAPADAGYHLAWDGEVFYYSQDEGRDLGAGETFGFGSYVTETAVIANEGYIFDPNVQVYLGDVLLADAGFEVEVTEEGKNVWLDRFDVLAPEYIEGASITGSPIPQLQVGDTLPELSYTVPEGANYTVETYWWKNGMKAPAGTAVENGNDYRLWIDVYAKEGYAFTHGFPLMINGEEHSFVPSNALGDGFEGCRFYKDYPFLTAIDKVEVSYTAPVVGQPMSDVTVAEGALYTADMEWYDYNDDENSWKDPGTVAVKGHKYEGTIDIYPNKGYMFTADTEIWVNGENITEDYAHFLDVDYNHICIETPKYNFMDAVAEAYVTYTEPVVGQPLPMPVAGTGNCVVNESNTGWYDHTTGQWMSPGDMAEKGHIYYLDLWVAPAAGYEFTEDIKLYVNGVLVEHNEGSDGCIVWNSEDYAFCDPIAKVELSYDEPVAGQPLSDVTAPADALYEVEANWYDYNDEDSHDKTPGTIAVRGHRYDVEIYVNPVEGYMFTQDTEVWVNGEKLTLDENAPDYVGIDSGEIYIDTREYSLADPVAEARLTYTEPVLGQVLPTPTVSGEGVKLEQWSWYDYYIDDTAPQGAVAEKMHTYELSAHIEAEEGYYFSEDTKVFINGVEMEISDIGFGEDVIYFYSDVYSFAEKLDSASFTLADPKVGQTFPEAVAPAGAKYMVYTEWYDLHADEWVESGAVVQDGCSYEVNIYIECAPGYDFAEDATLTVNGRKADEDEYYCDRSEMNFHRVYTFADPIAKVELPAIPELKLGGTIPQQITGSGKNYAYAVMVQGFDAEGNELTGSTVVEGGTYYSTVVAVPASGYEFTEDTVFTVGGKAPSAFAQYGRAMFGDYKIFSFGAQKVVQQVDLTTAIPGIGQEGGRVTTTGEDYTVEYFVWGVSPDGILENSQGAEGPYQAGDHVLLVVEVYAAEDALFSSDLKVTVNGKTYQPLQMRGTPGYMMFVLDLGEAQKLPDYNGLVVVDGVWGYYEGGILQEDYTGLVPYGDLIFYVENGILDFNYTGLAWYNDAWTYVANSQLTQGYTGLVWFNNEWFYVVDSVIDWTFTGLVPYEGNYFYVQNNHLDWSYTGLGYHDGGWYFIQNGLLQKNYSGLVYFNDNWFYVEEGVLTYQYFGMVEYEGNLFYVQASHLDWNYTGLGYHEGAWYYFQNALYTPSFSGLVPFNGSLFYVKDGTIDWSFNGSAEYDGITYTVVNGAVVV